MKVVSASFVFLDYSIAQPRFVWWGPIADFWSSSFIVHCTKVWRLCTRQSAVESRHAGMNESLKLKTFNNWCTTLCQIYHPFKKKNVLYINKFLLLLWN
jgi:hypothetical protein